MDKREKILSVKKQLSESWKCDITAFGSKQNIFMETHDTFFQMVTFGQNVVIRADKIMAEWCYEKFNSIPAGFIMDSDNFYLINNKLRSFGKKLGEENTRYLHLFPEKTEEKPKQFDYKMYDQRTVKELYKYKGFENSLDYDNELLAAATYDGETIAAIGGVDNNLGSLIWQIGIDTVLKYRNKGLGVYLVKELALEIERHKKIACYTTWNANLASTRLALHAGFSPVWIEYSSDNV